MLNALFLKWWKDINAFWFSQAAPKTFIPALFGHASEDKFIQPHHADLIFNSYAVIIILKLSFFANHIDSSSTN
jgi:hypothetical protein